MKILLIILISVFSLICFSSCKSILKNTQTDFVNRSSSNMEIYEESKYYKIVRENENIYCHFYNNNSKEVRIEGPLNKLPKVITFDNGLLRFTLQAGTGIGTQWGFFYDTNHDVFSDTFHCIHDQNENKLVFVESNKVIVRDIFDETKYYKEFIIDSDSFSKVAEPIINITFVQNGNAIEVTCLSGDDYKEITEIFTLNQ